MARHNYPFEKMSVEDHRLVFSDPRSRVPSAAELEGTWEGRLIFLTRPNVSLLNQAAPVLFRLEFRKSGRKLEARYRFGLASAASAVEMTPEASRPADPSGFQTELRMIDNDMLLARWFAPEVHPLVLRGLEDYLEPEASRFACYCVLKRA